MGTSDVAEPLNWRFLVAMAVIMLPILTLGVGLLSGWRSLARDFRVFKEAAGRQFRRQTIQFGMWISYTSCVRVIVSRDGLFLSLAFGGRWAHPDLLLPWSAVKEFRLRKVVFSEFAVLTIVSSMGSRKIQVEKAVGQSCLQWIGTSASPPALFQS